MLTNVLCLALTKKEMCWIFRLLVRTARFTCVPVLDWCFIDRSELSMCLPWCNVLSLSLEMLTNIIVEKDVLSVSDTSYSESSSNMSRTDDLLHVQSDALQLSYRRLVGA